MNLHIVLDPKEVAELKTLLDRALNTLPRQDWPVWVVELDEKVTVFCDGAAWKGTELGTATDGRSG